MRFLGVIVLVLCVVSPAFAGSPYRLYPELGPWLPTDYTLPNHICIFPDGRTSLQDAKFGDCELMITFLEHLFNGQWIREDYDQGGLMLDAGMGNVALCGEALPMLSVPGPPYLLYAAAIHGGGHSAVDATGSPVASAQVWWAPSSVWGHRPIELYINSPDINGDLVVNMTDYSLFATDYNGTYNFRSDFNYDNLVNVGDLTIFSSALGIDCY